MKARVGSAGARRRLAQLESSSQCHLRGVDPSISKQKLPMKATVLTKGGLNLQEQYNMPTELVVEAPPPPSAILPLRSGYKSPTGGRGGDKGLMSFLVVHNDDILLGDSNIADSVDSTSDLFPSNDENSQRLFQVSSDHVREVGFVFGEQNSKE